MLHLRQNQRVLISEKRQLIQLSCSWSFTQAADTFQRLLAISHQTLALKQYKHTPPLSTCIAPIALASNELSVLHDITRHSRWTGLHEHQQHIGHASLRVRPLQTQISRITYQNSSVLCSCEQYPMKICQFAVVQQQGDLQRNEWR